jgi:hypothetical protein
VRGFIKAYQLTGDEQLLAMSRELTNYCLLPSMWGTGWEWGISGHEHGLFEGHFHGNLMALGGILDYALAANDAKIKEIVREAYEHARIAGIARIGWFPAMMTPERFGRPAWIKRTCESCGIADMVSLAVALSDAGMGDYWDDVDQYVRNQLAEQQLVDPNLLASIANAARANSHKQNVTNDSETPWPTDSRDVLERMLGCFVGPGGDVSHIFEVTGAGCCTGNSPVGVRRTRIKTNFVSDRERDCLGDSECI